MTKLEHLRSKMATGGFDAVIVFDELNQRYLSDFAFSDGLLFITASSAHLLTDFRYYEMALSQANGDFKVSASKTRNDYIKDVISDEKIKTVGFEGSFVSVERLEALKKAHSGVEFKSVGSMIEEIRRLKTREETEKIQKAQNITDLAFEEVLKIIDPDKMTELDVAAELEYRMRKNGAEGFAFNTIAVSGDASSLPHGTPRCVKLKKGFLTMDFGAKFDGYCSDMTRTVVIGKADAEMKKLYNTVLTAQKTALDFLRAGVDAGEADKIARDIINKDYEGTFGHSLGHSVGLYIHESPSLSMKYFGYKLRAGEILTVEPGIYIFGKYGCRIEDMVEIQNGGVYNFTHSTKELIEIF